MSDYNTTKKSHKLTSREREVLARYHIAVTSLPSTEQLIKDLNLDTTKQNIQQIAKRMKARAK